MHLLRSHWWRERLPIIWGEFMLIALYHLFPRTIHPMVIHFTIAIIYLSSLAGLLGIIWRNEVFYARAFTWLLFLGVVAAIAAGVAGVISEYYVTVSPVVGPILDAHKRDGEITGVVELIAFGIQVLVYWQKKKVSNIALVVAVVATILVSVTGSLGGSMVYDHGLGVQIQHTTSGHK